jgi:enterochelin esterase-like enzyme
MQPWCGSWIKRARKPFSRKTDIAADHAPAMNGLLLLALLPLLQAAPASAQSQPATPPAVVSPEVLPDHRVVFRLLAPNANEVTLTGSFWLQEGRTEKLAKDSRGVWSLTTEPLPADDYSYSFTVDGTRALDPVNGRIKQGVLRTVNAFSVPGQEAAFLEAGPVPHGEVRVVFHQSRVAGMLCRMHVYLPPGYETGQTRYPVVYLLHGGGDTDSTWIDVGRANFILDNLMAQGKARPMIVVMPSLWSFDPSYVRTHRDENQALFQRRLVDEIVPYVESSYRVLAGPGNRALGGLGVMRDFLPNVVWATLGKFGYVFHTSGGVDPEWIPLLEKKYPGVLDNPANTRAVKFFIGSGTNDHSNPSAKSWLQELKKRGYDATYFESNGNHEWPSFRRYFAQFAQTAFR